MPLWGLLLGLMVDGRPVAGWCRQPYLDETFAAIAGTGWLEHAGRRQALRTRSTTDLSAATMYSTHPGMFVAAWERAAFEALTGAVRLQRFGGDCYSYCMLALGQVDLVVEASLAVLRHRAADTHRGSRRRRRHRPRRESPRQWRLCGGGGYPRAARRSPDPRGGRPGAAGL